MRAAVLDAPGASLQVYDDVEAEAPRAGEVAVRVVALRGVPQRPPPGRRVDAAHDPDRARPRGGRRGRGRRPRRHPPGAGRPRRAHAVPAVRPLLLVPAGRVLDLHQRHGAGHVDPPRRRHPAEPRRRDRLPRPRRGRLRRAGGHPGDRRGEDPRRRAARRRLRGRLRGADRASARSSTPPRCSPATRCWCSGSAASVSRSCRAPAWPAPRRSSCRDPVAERREAGAAASARPTPSTRPPTTCSRPCMGLTEVGVDFAFDAVGRAALDADDGLAATRGGGHHGDGRRAADRRAARDRVADVLRLRREEAARLPARRRQLAARHPAADRPVARRACSTSTAWSRRGDRWPRSTRRSTTCGPVGASAPSSRSDPLAASGEPS